MATLVQRIQNTLNESRMLVLGVQVLLGFGFEAAFQRPFAALPPAFRDLVLLGIFALVAALALLLAPAAYHQIALEGHARRELEHFGNRVLAVAALPLGGALGANVAVVGERAGGAAVGWGAGATVLSLALSFWYGTGLLVRRKGGGHVEKTDDADENQRAQQILTEARVILPGVQALLGFGLIVALTDKFAELASSLRLVHLGALFLNGLAIVGLMMPAAFHRIAERGDVTERFLRVASGFVIAAMVPLALAVSADLGVVVEVATGSPPAAVASSVVAALVFFSVWFAYPLAVRRRSRIP